MKVFQLFHSENRQHRHIANFQIVDETRLSNEMCCEMIYSITQNNHTTWAQMLSKRPEYNVTFIAEDIEFRSTNPRDYMKVVEDGKTSIYICDSLSWRQVASMV